MPVVKTIEITEDEYKIFRMNTPSFILDAMPDRTPTGEVWAIPWWVKLGLLGVGVMLVYSLGNRLIGKVIG